MNTDTNKNRSVANKDCKVSTPEQLILELKKEKKIIAKTLSEDGLPEDKRIELKRSMQLLNKKLKKEEKLFKKQRSNRKEPELHKDEIPEIPERYLFQSENIEVGQYEIRAVNEDDFEKWNNYVGNHPNSTLYHLFEWRSFNKGFFAVMRLYF